MSEKKNTGKKAVIAVIVIALIVVIIALVAVISGKSKKGGSKSATAVSYTHLTLPTILRV